MKRKRRKSASQASDNEKRNLNPESESNSVEPEIKKYTNNDERKGKGFRIHKIWRII